MNFNNYRSRSLHYMWRTGFCHLSHLGRSSSKLEEVKNQYVRSESKVRNAHNNYLLALCEVNLYQQQYSCIMLPSLLDLQQRLQENLIMLWFVNHLHTIDGMYMQTFDD